MDVFKSIILGIIQGFAEFLPISSSGHLVLSQRLFGLEEPMMAFDIMLHLGSLTAVFIVFWSDIWRIIKHPFQKMTLLLIIATIPAVVAALLFEELIEILFSGSIFLAIGFLITGTLLIASDNIRPGRKLDDDINFVDALLIGCMQAIGIPPGVSRSGSTITGALARGLTRETAAKFSFLLSIPTILGAAVFTLKDFVSSGETFFSNASLLFGFLSAALSGYLSIKFMLALINKCRLRYFAYYVIILAFLILLDHFTFGYFF